MDPQIKNNFSARKKRPRLDQKGAELKRSKSQVKSQNKSKDTKDRAKKAKHVPVFLHRHLDYLREGEKKLSGPVKQAYAFIKARCEIPENFEGDQKFGPLSGICFEERVISAYRLKMLEMKKGLEYISVCTMCGSRGHDKYSCPDAF